jgi:hypothetical protein
MKTVICASDPHAVIQFAARELARYLRRATGAAIPIVKAAAPAANAAALRLGLCRAAEGNAFDDRIRIEPEGRGNRLEGSNPRSVLFAVYRYLYELGFRWIRPGVRGEIIPRLKGPVLRGLRIDEIPSYRYRTICIEGAASQRHVTDMIDWLAKQGMNGYFVQFDLAHGAGFWERWYRHQDNPRLRKEGLSAARVKKIGDAVTAAIEKRGLRFESMGHGWTSAALGVYGKTGVTSKQQVPAARRGWLPQINGKRDLLPGGPGNTNLCYSNPAVRRAMAAEIVAYARSHPSVTALHVWLSDGSNNNCECPNCRSARPADFYMDILNELDAQLTTAGLATRIVFLIYVDLLWPPLKRRIRNPERFILMFAPITRSYAESFVDARRAESMAPYVRNRLTFPNSAAGNIGYLKAWRKLFKGDAFDFDYHLIWMPYADLAQFTLARVLHRDIRGLGTIGLCGYNSCQNQRQSFPHNLGMDVMARTLWNRRIPFRRILNETFTDAYGREGLEVARFFERMSALAGPFYEWVHTYKFDPRRIAAGLRNLPRMQELAEGLRTVVQRNRPRTSGAVQWSWRYLAIYIEIMDRLIPALEAYLRRDPACRARYEAVFDYVRRQEPVVHPVLDVFEFIKVSKGRVDEMERARPRA